MLERILRQILARRKASFEWSAWFCEAQRRRRQPAKQALRNSPISGGDARRISRLSRARAYLHSRN